MATTASPLSSVAPPATPLIDASSMLSSFPGDIFAGISDIPEDAPPADDTPLEMAPDDAPVEDTPIDDAPAEDEPFSAEPADTEAPPVDAVAAEELPEGVTKGKDSKGREKYFLDKSRYGTIYNDHRFVAQQAPEIIGEPLTLDALKLRNDAYLGQERMFTHLTSGDPKLQGDVVNYMIQEMNGAREAGETGVDPTVPFAETVYASLRDNSPDGYAHLRMQAARDFIGEMFEDAARSGDTGLISSMQHAARKLAGVGPKPEGMSDADYLAQVREATSVNGIPFFTPQDLQETTRPEDPASRLARENAELKAQLNGRAGTSSTEQWKTWNDGHTRAVNKAIFDDAVTPALSTVADAWKTFPDDYQKQVIDPLNREVAKVVGNDPVLNQRVTELQQMARRATSEQARKSIGAQIQQLVVNRAKLAADQAKPGILRTAADWLKFKSQQTNDRRAAGQTRTAPKGPGTPVKRSLLPDMPTFKGASAGSAGTYDSATAFKQASRLLAALNR